MIQSRAVSWTDGDEAPSGDGCGLLVARLAAAACAVVLAIALRIKRP